MPSPLKVLMICPQFWPIIGGYERAAERLSSELVNQGCEVTVLTEQRDKAWVPSESLGGFMIRRLWCIYRPGIHTLTSFLSFGVFFLLKGKRFDVFHVHQYGTHAAFLVFLGWILQRPVVLKLTSTGKQGICNVINSSKGLRKKIFLTLHRNVDACVVTSKAAKQEALEFGIPSDRIYLVPNGLDVNIFKPIDPLLKMSIKEQFGLKNKLIVLYVGRLSEEKNPIGLAKAWSKICHDHHDAVLVYVGMGPQFDLLNKEVLSLGCGKSVRLVGASSDVLSWYQASDVYVLPSHHEGLSNSLLEAMACGLPIISTNVSGSEDVFAEVDIGVLVEVGDQEGLSAALKKLLTSEEQRVQCGHRAREFAQRKFSLEVTAQDMMKIYKKQ